jgi:hypothetical protein
MAAEEERTRALQDNDADGIARCLSDDWAVISARGGVGEGKSILPEGIKSDFLNSAEAGRRNGGYLIRETMLLFLIYAEAMQKMQEAILNLF